MVLGGLEDPVSDEMVSLPERLAREVMNDPGRGVWRNGWCPSRKTHGLAIAEAVRTALGEAAKVARSASLCFCGAEEDEARPAAERCNIRIDIVCPRCDLGHAQASPAVIAAAIEALKG